MSNNLSKENLLMLSIFAIFFAVIVLFYADSIHDDVYGMIYMSPIILCIVLSFSLFRRYKKTRNFSLGFLFVGLANLSLLIAEFLWLLMSYLEIKQYESYPDIFYIGYAISSLVFPWFILKHYKIHFTRMSFTIKKQKIHLISIQHLTILLITIIGVLFYVILSYDVMESPSFALGLTFVSLSSMLVGISIITMITLKNTNIFTVWIIITFSFFISGITDIWYYANENTTGWNANSWTNIVWFVSYLILIFALNKQNYLYITKRDNN